MKDIVKKKTKRTEVLNHKISVDQVELTICSLGDQRARVRYPIRTETSRRRILPLFKSNRTSRRTTEKNPSMTLYDLIGSDGASVREPLAPCAAGVGGAPLTAAPRLEGP